MRATDGSFSLSRCQHSTLLREITKSSHFEFMASNQKSDYIGLCVITRGAFLPNFIPIRFETAQKKKKKKKKNNNNNNNNNNNCNNNDNKLSNDLTPVPGLKRTHFTV